MTKYTLTMLAVLMFNVSAVNADGDCTTTHECAQRMVDALSLLNDADEETREILLALTSRIQDIDAARIAGDEAILAQANAAATQVFQGIGNGRDEVPTWGTASSSRCPAGSYMVGARVNVAGGRNAGALYSNIDPVCRRFVVP